MQQFLIKRPFGEFLSLIWNYLIIRIFLYFHDEHFPNIATRSVILHNIGAVLD